MSGEPWVVSKFWWIECCSIASFVEVPDTSGYDTIYNRCKTHERCSRKKNFSEYLVDSKSCCTFAFATQKKGVSERAWWSDWSEVSDIVSRETYSRKLWGFLSSVALGFPMGFPTPMKLSKKNFSEYLVVSKTCCTFAPTTRKKKQFALHVWRDLELGLLTRGYAYGDYRSDLWYIS